MLPVVEAEPALVDELSTVVTEAVVAVPIRTCMLVARVGGWRIGGAATPAQVPVPGDQTAASTRGYR
jgi:hypothetical protein